MYLSQFDNLITGPTREGTLPPGINTALPASGLDADQSPDCYGLDLSLDGKIGVGTIPTGTTRIAKTVTLDVSSLGGGSAVPFLLYYGRLWNITGLTNAGTSTTLKIGAPNYESEWLLQSTDFSFSEDAQPILGIIPFGQGGMAVLKSTGIYVVENVYDPRGTQYFRRSDIVQEMAVDSLAHVTELDGVLYVCNANGLIKYEDGKTTDLTAPVRDNRTGYVSLALKADYINKRIIATDDASTGFVYDVPSEKLFKYSGSNFRYTSPRFHSPMWHEVAIDGLVFVIEHGDTEDGTLTYQYRYEEEEWSDEATVYLEYGVGKDVVVREGLGDSRRAYHFQIRITDLSANKRIDEIRLTGASWNE